VHESFLDLAFLEFPWFLRNHKFVFQIESKWQILSKSQHFQVIHDHVDQLLLVDALKIKFEARIQNCPVFLIL